MKAKLISESISFERGVDPKSQMGIGEKQLQSIQKDYKDLGPLINDGTAKEIDFRKTRWKIDNIKNIMEYIIINHIKKKYNIDLELVEKDPDDRSRYIPENLIAKASLPDRNYIGIYKNGPGNAFWFVINEDKSTQSYSLSSFDKKLESALKTWRIV